MAAAPGVGVKVKVASGPRLENWWGIIGLAQQFPFINKTGKHSKSKLFLSKCNRAIILMDWRVLTQVVHVYPCACRISRNNVTRDGLRRWGKNPGYGGLRQHEKAVNIDHHSCMQKREVDFHIIRRCACSEINLRVCKIKLNFFNPNSEYLSKVGRYRGRM